MNRLDEYLKELGIDIKDIDKEQMAELLKMTGANTGGALAGINPWLGAAGTALDIAGSAYNNFRLTPYNEKDYTRYGNLGSLALNAGNTEYLNLEKNNTIGNSISGAAKGAGAGFMVGGPIGAAIGGGLGLATGLVSSIFGNDRKRVEEKRRYRKAFNDIMNSAEYMKNKTKYSGKWNDFAFGGGIRRYADGGQLVHGGFFNDGVDFIDTGGTHEKNKYGGVPISIDPEGNVNSAEQGEVVWNNYIFSNRVKPSMTALEASGLNKKKFEGKPFSKLARDFSTESAERPYDPIAIATRDNGLTKLMIAQELEKMKSQGDQAINGLNQFAEGGPVRTKGSSSVDVNKEITDTILRIYDDYYAGKGEPPVDFDDPKFKRKVNGIVDTIKAYIPEEFLNNPDRIMEFVWDALIGKGTQEGYPVIDDIEASFSSKGKVRSAQLQENIDRALKREDSSQELNPERELLSTIKASVKENLLSYYELSGVKRDDIKRDNIIIKIADAIYDRAKKNRFEFKDDVRDFVNISMGGRFTESPDDKFASIGALEEMAADGKVNIDNPALKGNIMSAEVNNRELQSGERPAPNRMPDPYNPIDPVINEQFSRYDRMGLTGIMDRAMFRRDIRNGMYDSSEVSDAQVGPEAEGAEGSSPVMPSDSTMVSSSVDSLATRSIADSIRIRPAIDSTAIQPADTVAVTQRPDSIIQRTDSVIQRPDSIVQRQSSIVQRQDSIIHRPDTVIQRPDSIVQRADSVALTQRPDSASIGQPAPQAPAVTPIKRRPPVSRAPIQRAPGFMPDGLDWMPVSEENRVRAFYEPEEEVVDVGPISEEEPAEEQAASNEGDTSTQAQASESTSEKKADDVKNLDSTKDMVDHIINVSYGAFMDKLKSKYPDMSEDEMKERATEMATNLAALSANETGWFSKSYVKGQRRLFNIIARGKGRYETVRGKDHDAKGNPINTKFRGYKTVDDAILDAVDLVSNRNYNWLEGGDYMGKLEKGGYYTGTSTTPPSKITEGLRNIAGRIKAGNVPEGSVGLSTGRYESLRDAVGKDDSAASDYGSKYAPIQSKIERQTPLDSVSKMIGKKIIPGQEEPVKTRLSEESKMNLPAESPTGTLYGNLLKRELANRPSGLPRYTSAMMAAPIFSNIAGLAEAYTETPEKVQYDVVDPIMLPDRMEYKPINQEYLSDRVRNQYAASRRGALESAGGNRGLSAYLTMQNDRNMSDAIYDAYMQGENANFARRQAVSAFNADIGKFNSQMDLQAQAQNVQMDMNEQNMNAQNRAALRSYQSQMRSKLAEDIQGLGKYLRWEYITPIMYGGYTPWALRQDQIARLNQANKQQQSAKVNKNKNKIGG